MSNMTCRHHTNKIFKEMTTKWKKVSSSLVYLTIVSNEEGTSTPAGRICFKMWSVTNKEIDQTHNIKKLKKVILVLSAQSLQN